MARRDFDNAIKRSDLDAGPVAEGEFDPGGFKCRLRFAYDAVVKNGAFFDSNDRIFGEFCALGQIGNAPL